MDLPTLGVHVAGFLGLVVVPAGQMQHAVNDEQVELEGHGHADPLRLATGGVGADDHLAEQAGRSGRIEIKGQHVGRGAAPEIACVQAANLAVTHHAHVELTVTASERVEGGLGGAAKAVGKNTDPALEVADCDGHQTPGEGDSSSPPSGERAG